MEHSRDGLPADLELPQPVAAATFAEPWHATAFAIAVQLSRSGLFAWPEWADVFGAEIARHPQRPDETGDAAYYRQWLAALETMLARHGIATATEIAECQEHWRRSYLNTPEGEPIAFSREWGDTPGHAARDDDGEPAHCHGRARREPLAVSPPKAPPKP